MAQAQRQDEGDDLPPAEPDVLEDANRPSDWGSLVADLSRSQAREPSWRIHDRTHLEFALDYALAKGEASFEWEAFFFVPESLRLEESTYDKQDIYTDLVSYMRFAVPEVAFGELTGAPLERLRETLARRDVRESMREMRLYACEVRAAGVTARRTIATMLGNESARSRAFAAVARFTTDARRVADGLRDALAVIPDDDDTLATARDWVDEDVSRLIETMLATLAEKLRDVNAPRALSSSVVDAAVAEARYREAKGLEGVGKSGASKDEVEHLEFRRHVLKRFTSSVLWLKPEVRDAARWTLHVLYALSAGVAMAFALAAAIINGNDVDRERVWMWAMLVIAAYMLKDRIKASLQSFVSRFVSRHFPDRRWRLFDRERDDLCLGQIDEQSGFVPFAKVPEPVLAMRRATRRHPLEEQARPENVLWHRKALTLDPRKVAEADPRFDALTEIFRLDLRRWLAHTDDPKRKIVFADPTEGTIGSAIAPRVYNIGVVYRLRRRDDSQAAWHRVRVVVSRKGIRRIDRIC